MLQAGINFNSFCISSATGIGGITTTQTSSYSIWYEWYPSSEVVISNIPVNAGDEVFTQVISNSPTQATAFIVNESTGQ